jgi:hypothetical protein
MKKTKMIDNNGFPKGYSLFSAEETLKAERGNLWSCAAKADKYNIRKDK